MGVCVYVCMCVVWMHVCGGCAWVWGCAWVCSSVKCRFSKINN